MKTIRTAESVCAGHPDKLCDFIADSVLDTCLKADPECRVGRLSEPSLTERRRAARIQIPFQI